MFSELLSSWRKARGTKYKRKVPYMDKRTGKRRFRYYYKEHHGGGITKKEAMVEGAAYKLTHKGQIGHFHITKVEGDQLTIRHDEHGGKLELSKVEFQRLLHIEHGEALGKVAERAEATLKQAKKDGSPKQIKRAEAEARKMREIAERGGALYGTEELLKINAERAILEARKKIRELEQLRTKPIEPADLSPKRKNETDFGYRRRIKLEKERVEREQKFKDEGLPKDFKENKERLKIALKLKNSGVSWARKQIADRVGSGEPITLKDDLILEALELAGIPRKEPKAEPKAKGKSPDRRLARELGEAAQELKAEAQDLERKKASGSGWDDEDQEQLSFAKEASEFLGEGAEKGTEWLVSNFDDMPPDVRDRVMEVLSGLSVDWEGMDSKPEPKAKPKAPKAEAKEPAPEPKAKAPKAKAPKAKAPKAKAPKVKAEPKPKAEAPKVKAPKAKAPKALGKLKGHEGKKARLIMPGASGRPQRHKIVYALVEADSVIASHNPETFTEREDYPKGIQERDYYRDKTEQRKVVLNAQNFIPEMQVSTNPDAVNGPPILTPSGHAIGGNSRAMTVQRLHAIGDLEEQRGEYLDLIREEAASFGLDPAQVDGLKKPMLVRVLEDRFNTPDEMRNLVRVANESFTGGMSAEVKARRAGLALSPKALRVLSASLESHEGSMASFLTTPSDKLGDVVQELRTGGMITEQNFSEMVRDTGRGQALTQQGVAAVESALSGRLVPDLGVLSNLPEGFKSKKLPQVALELAKEGKLDQFQEPITNALRAYTAMVQQEGAFEGLAPRAKVSLVNTRLQQKSLLGEDEQMSAVKGDPLTREWLNLFISMTGPRVAQRKVRAVLKGLEGESGLFPVPPKEPLDAVRDATGGISVNAS